MKYKRVLLKLSGEFLAGNTGKIDIELLKRLSAEIKEVHDLGVEIMILVGGGNLFRGTSIQGIERTTADHIGLLSTVINALSLQNILEQHGLSVRTMSAVEMNTFCEKFLVRRALRHLEKRRILIFAAGLGVPYFTTDTAAVLRASEMKCDVLLKGTQVNGVYDSNPKINPDAKKFDTISALDVIKNRLEVMDASAISLALTNKLDIIVFSIQKSGNLKSVLSGCGEYTVIKSE